MFFSNLYPNGEVGFIVTAITFIGFKTFIIPPFFWNLFFIFLLKKSLVASSTKIVISLYLSVRLIKSSIDLSVSAPFIIIYFEFSSSILAISLAESNGVRTSNNFIEFLLSIIPTFDFFSISCAISIVC